MTTGYLQEIRHSSGAHSGWSLRVLAIKAEQGFQIRNTTHTRMHAHTNLPEQCKLKAPRSLEGCPALNPSEHLHVDGSFDAAPSKLVTSAAERQNGATNSMCTQPQQNLPSVEDCDASLTVVQVCGGLVRLAGVY